ncbi:MAG: histidine phosphatase family protein [Rhodospirillaceae bacterium]|nr:histidine phosphatase family protein [Rhodospirillaceae bacterium]
MTGDATRWWWVRHAPVTGHDGKIYGQSDVPCDTSDTASFRALAHMLPDGAVWVSSHLGRTLETAAAIRAAGKPAPEPAPEPDFAEQHFGDWQTQSWDDLHAGGTPEYRAFWENPGHSAAPGGESFADLIVRVTAVMARLNGDHDGRDIVAVAHGGTIRAALATALDLKPARALAIKIDTLSLTRMDYVPGGLFEGQGGMWRIVSVNVPPR